MTWMLGYEGDQHRLHRSRRASKPQFFTGQALVFRQLRSEFSLIFLWKKKTQKNHRTWGFGQHPENLNAQGNSVLVRKKNYTRPSLEWPRALVLCPYAPLKSWNSWWCVIGEPKWNITERSCSAAGLLRFLRQLHASTTEIGQLSLWFSAEIGGCRLRFLLQFSSQATWIYNRVDPELPPPYQGCHGQSTVPVLILKKKIQWGDHVFAFQFPIPFHKCSSSLILHQLRPRFVCILQIIHHSQMIKIQIHINW